MPDADEGNEGQNIYRRRTWDETWMITAQVMSSRSRCVRSKVGAVIVDPTNRVVATAYNGPPAGYPTGTYLIRNVNGEFDVEVEEECSWFCTRGEKGPSSATLQSYTDCVSLHAEANALMVCDRRDRNGGAIYTTSDVCWGCAKLIANSGLKRVVVPRPSGEFEYREPRASYTFLQKCGLVVDYL